MNTQREPCEASELCELREAFDFHDFSFDEWAALAKADPLAFESRRQRLIADFLRASGKQQKVGESLQREIDAVRARAESPADALVALTAMLSDHLVFLGEELTALRESLGAVQTANERVHTLLASQR